MELYRKILDFKDGSLESSAESISFDDIKKLNIDIAKNTSGIFEVGARLKSHSFANGKLFLGAYSYMNDGGYLRENVFIGRYCSIGRRVTIGAGMHSMSGLSTSPCLRGVKSSPYTTEQKRNIKFGKKNKFTIIENDVWIGDGAVILPGVSIGTGAVIGANSVVTKDVGDYQIHAGIPAKQIGERFDEQSIQELCRSEWWEYGFDLLNSMPLSNIYEVLKKLPAEKQHYTHFQYKS